jgi:hypothetical protein
MKNLIIRIWSKLKGWGIALYNLPLQKKIGYLFLVPPIIGVYQFLNFIEHIPIGSYDWNDVWMGHAVYSYEGRLRLHKFQGLTSLNSNIPVFLGLMAIAGAYLIKDREK